MPFSMHLKHAVCLNPLFLSTALHTRQNGAFDNVKEQPLPALCGRETLEQDIKIRLLLKDNRVDNPLFLSSLFLFTGSETTV